MKQSSALLKRNRDGGFSLMESILSVMLLSATFATSFKVMEGSLTSSVDQAQYIHSSQLAYDKLQQIIADNSSLGFDYATNPANYPEQVVNDFGMTVSFAEVDPNSPDAAMPGSDMKKVSVEASWEENADVKSRYSTLVIRR